VPAARSFPEGTSIRNSTYDPRTSAAGGSRSPFTGRAFPRVPGTAVPLGPHFEDHARRSRSAFDPELFENGLEMFGDRGFGRSRRWFFLPRPTPRPVSRDESAAHTHLPALTAASPFPRPALEARGLSHHGWRCVMTHDHQFAEGSARGERQADGGARPGPEETGASVETEVFASWSRLAIDAGHTETAPRGPAMKATASSKSVLS